MMGDEMFEWSKALTYEAICAVPGFNPQKVPSQMSSLSFHYNKVAVNGRPHPPGTWTNRNTDGQWADKFLFRLSF